MDRTAEFSTLAESVKRKQEQNGASISNRNKNMARSQRSTFSYAAANISKGVYETSQKLSQLTQMAKNTDLFMDSSAQVEELTYIIKQDIQNLNTEIKALDSISRASRQPNKQTEDHSETIVGFLNLKLVTATKDFKDILEVRTESLKQQQEKLDSITGQSNTSTFFEDTGSKNPTKNSYSNDTFSIRHRNTNRDALDDYNTAYGGESNEHSILMPQEMVTTNHTAERLRAAEGITATIHQLESIFTQLANLVSQQGEVIERIDTNIDDSLMNVGRGRDSLVKTLSDLSTNRGLIIKIFLVLIVFMVIFIVFMA